MIIDLNKSWETRKLCFKRAKSSATTVENKFLTGVILNRTAATECTFHHACYAQHEGGHRFVGFE